MTGQLSSNLPLFPLNTVLFPGGRLPLRIFEQRYMDMAKACLKDGSPFGVCLIREGREVGEPAIPADVGTLARITTWDMPQLGVLQVLAVGSQRFRIRERRVEPGGLARGDVELMDADQDAAIPENCARCVKILQRVVDEQPDLLEAPQMASASWVGSRLAELLPLPLEAKQELLELTDARARLERINALLGG
jgi:Lon protease-like protein